MRWLAAVVVGLIAFAGCHSSSRVEAPAVSTAASALQSREWLFEIMRHLYRWYIDERDLDAVVGSGEIVFLVREVRPSLDEGDRSLFGEVVLPQFHTLVKVKRADYEVPELDVSVRNDSFKVTSVGRPSAAQQRGDGFTEVRVAYTELRDHLFRTRYQAPFPEGELLERMRSGVRAQVAKEMPNRRVEPGPQVVYLAPLSRVANEVWVFWETGRMLIHVASDIELANPAVWEHEEMSVKLIDLEKSVVVSLDEAAGSNAFVTRDLAGRALFNAIVLGKRVELTPAEDRQGG